ncbi:lipopolysaccharide biosynthesis protein [Flavobacterium sp. AG291]|uniref:lipopolysaccharide biosynthesis protein n=1 Tax=Flavobacterium sp. AG291 TaxID=2184000 RepID=UPI000E0B5805|nr:lipopolysaccharide biosynthesis protein [Flavobacterium sp. AG291]RDI12190.1 subunit length determinant protein [Flavobacterium sp. AG291]
MDNVNKVKIQEDLNVKDITMIIKDWWYYFLSKSRLILLTGILGGAIGVAYSLKKKDIYVAKLSFAVEDDKQGGIGGAMGLASQFGLDVGGGGGGIFTGANLVELFKSRSMVESTLLMPVIEKNKTISLAEMYISENGWRNKWKDMKQLNNVQFLAGKGRENFSRSQDSILELIYRDLSTNSLSIIQKDKKASIYTVEVKSTNEIFSKTFNEAWANVVSDFYIDTKSKKARVNMAILQRQLDSIRGELNGSIRGVAAANDRTFSLNPALNIQRVPSVRKQVDVQANTAILTELIKQTELSKVTLRKETPLIQIIDRPIYPLSKESFSLVKGIFMGALTGSFSAVLFLIFKKIFKDMMI